MLKGSVVTRSLGGRRETSNNKASVFLHTADPYVVANDSVKYQGESRPWTGGSVPSRECHDITGLVHAPLPVEKHAFHLSLVLGGC